MWTYLVSTVVCIADSLKSIKKSQCKTQMFSVHNCVKSTILTKELSNECEPLPVSFMLVL